MLKKQFDLHLHSCYSDGKDLPEAIFRRARRARLSLISITDHNSISHIPEEKKLAVTHQLPYLPGVELSCVYEGRHIHLLGYGFDHTRSELKKIIAQIQAQRRADIFTIVRKLQTIGFDITTEELTRLKAEYYGLAHIIDILFKKPTEKRRILKEVGSRDIFAIINHYFAVAQEAYVPEQYLPAVKVIKLIRACGGITSLAHPGSHLAYRDDRLVAQLAACGLSGIEVFTPKHNWDQIIHYEILTKKLKLVATAGSNYHEDFHQHDIPIVTPIGFLKTPEEIFDRFMRYVVEKTKFPPRP